MLNEEEMYVKGMENIFVLPVREIINASPMLRSSHIDIYIALWVGADEAVK